MVRHVIAPVDELPPGTRKFLTIDERPIAVFNIKGEFFGLLNRCPHQGAALCEGPLIGLATSTDPGEIEYTRLGRNHPLPVARLGIRHPHRAILLRPQTLPRPRLPGERRTGGGRGERAVCRRDHRGVGRERLRGGGFVAPAVIARSVSDDLSAVAFGEGGSNPSLAGLAMGLLRGACHRARVRATRWLYPPSKLRRFTRKGQMEVAPATKQPAVGQISKKLSGRLSENMIGPDRLFALAKGRCVSNREVFEYPVGVVMARSWSPTSFRKAFHIKGNDDLRWVSLTYALQVFQTTFQLGSRFLQAVLKF